MLVLLEQRKCMLFALTLEQQSTDKSWAAPEMSWGNLEETPSQGAQGTDFIRPLLYGAALKKIDYAFPGKKTLLKGKLCGSQGLVILHDFCAQQKAQLDLPCHMFLLGGRLQE